jgi:hypothetical protein
MVASMYGWPRGSDFVCVPCLCVNSEGGATAPYRLLTGFPPAELTDFGRTIEEAGLKSARITQKLV